MSTQPLVTVICLCYNHEDYVMEALQSVANQMYGNVEVIICDDASTDASKSEIEAFAQSHPDCKTIFHEQNLGNCRSFNECLKYASGQFIIDLAADDILAPDRISTGISVFEELGYDYGVLYSNAQLINAKGEPLGLHDKEDQPQGNLYQQLVERYFICPTSMMMRREVFEVLSGYDETLSYEDFDFWIRSSRTFLYGYQPEVLVSKRILKKSLSQSQSKFANKHQKSTLAVCRKISKLNRNMKERAALSKRVWYECGQCLKTGNLHLIPGFVGCLL
ncbi:MAG: glycosyltransferase family 2 protein [Cyclobacteriaceae bacterium]